MPQKAHVVFLKELSCFLNIERVYSSQPVKIDLFNVVQSEDSDICIRILLNCSIWLKVSN